LTTGIIWAQVQKFERFGACFCTCALIIWSVLLQGISDETLRWKLFPFSLEGKAKIWYKRTTPSNKGNWEALCSSFCLDFFPISKIVCFRLEILSFMQEDESVIAA
jgi:hypothetical protein